MPTQQPREEREDEEVWEENEAGPAWVSVYSASPGAISPLVYR